MKIGVAQIGPVAGDISINVDRHRKLIDLAVSDGADLLVFPELSLTGYEPALADKLATDPNDRCFDVFQNISDDHGISIAVGAPLRCADGICISLIVLQPGSTRQVYSKQHLHRDEEPFFVPGPASDGLIGESSKIALAICYELSVPIHAANASKNGAQIYVASVAKAVGAMDKAMARLAEIAREHSMMVLVSNCIGASDGCRWGGRTSAWNNQGDLLAQMDDATEGIIVVDTNIQHAARMTHC